MECAICQKPFKDDDVTTIRQSWIDLGGYGKIPKYAIVHVHCDKVEQEDAETAKMIDEWADQSSEQFWKNIRKIEKDLREQDADS